MRTVALTEGLCDQGLVFVEISYLLQQYRFIQMKVWTSMLAGVRSALVQYAELAATIYF